ncbi:MAG: hypothetical protein J6B10_06070 [Lachnospiraceae bacterium]|nr:hypothetical protein [Lachnospiraceae bacterium]
MNRRKHKKRKYELKRIRRLQKQTGGAKRRRVGKSVVSDGAMVYSDSVNDILDRNHFAKGTVQLLVNKTADMTVPPCFSMINNPEETIAWIRKLYAYGQDVRIEKIRFSHLKCYDIDLAASTFMDIVVASLKRYRRKIKRPLHFEGKMPTDGECKDILVASGIVKHLNAYTTGTYDEKKVKPFPLVEGRYLAGKSDKVATELTQYYNKCLKEHGYMLNVGGKNRLSHIFGEVLLNCESHGGEDSIWYALGHYQFYENEKVGELQLTFITLGNTIYEGIHNAATSETKAKLQKLFERHKSLFSSNWTKEMAATVFSLQEGVSRLRSSASEGNSSRGNGTINMIRLLNEIGRTDSGSVPQISITSGNTHIVFDGKYQLLKQKFEQDEIFGSKVLSIIAFNENNDIYEKADVDSVKCIKQHFPGTAISIKFYLDSKYLEKMHG